MKCPSKKSDNFIPRIIRMVMEKWPKHEKQQSSRGPWLKYTNCEGLPTGWIVSNVVYWFISMDFVLVLLASGKQMRQPPCWFLSRPWCNSFGNFYPSGCSSGKIGGFLLPNSPTSCKKNPSPNSFGKSRRLTPKNLCGPKSSFRWWIHLLVKLSHCPNF